MRRTDREITDYTQMLKILDECDCCRLGFSTERGAYIVPMNFGWEEQDGQLLFYLHGAAEGRKAELMRQNGVCSFQMDSDHRTELLPNGMTTRYRCLMGKATIRQLTEEEKPRAMRILSGRYFPDAPDCPPQALARTAMWQLTVTEWSGKENKA